MTMFLNISPLQKSNYQQGKDSAEFCCPMISETQFLNAAGNSIRISQICDADFDAEISYHAGEWKESDIDVVATAERGFTCIAYNTYLGRIAYSPRSSSPVIYVKALHDRRNLCSLEEGAMISYQDISFSRKGSRIAAIGRGSLDAKIFVWKLKSEVSNGATVLNTVPIVSFPIQQPVHCCLFDPNDENTIALLSSDRRSVFKGQLIEFVGGKFKIALSAYPLPRSHKNGYISTISWENNSVLLLGFKDGSILKVNNSEICPSAIPMQPLDNHGAVRKIVVTCEYVILAYEYGRLVWFKRHNSLTDFCLEDQVHQEDLKSDPLYVTTTPDYKNIVTYMNDGSMHLIPIQFYDEKIGEEIGGSCTVSGNRISIQFPTGVVTGMACVNLTGKFAFSIVLSGSSDGQIKAWPDSKCKGNPNAPHRRIQTIGCIDIGTPITSMTSLSGSVFVVGCADGSLKFIVVSRKNLGKVDLIIIKSEILSLSAITHLAYNPKTKKLAAGCFDSGQIFVLCTEASNLHVIGVLEVEHDSESRKNLDLAALFWSLDYPTHLFVGTLTKVLYCFDTVHLCFPPTPLNPFLEISLSAIARGFIRTSRLGMPYTRLLACTGVEGGIELYEIIACSKSYVMKEKVQQFINTPQATSVIFTENQMIVGTNTGEVHIVEESKEVQCNARIAPKLLCNSLISITVSSDGEKLYLSSEWDVAVQPCLGPIREIPRSSYDYDYLVPTKSENRMIKNERVADKSQTWLCKAKNIGIEGMDASMTEVNLEVVHRLEKLSTQIQTVIDSNEKDVDNPNAKIDFVVDMEGFKRKESELMTKLEAFRNKAHRKLVNKEGLIETMLEHQIRCMEGYLRVYEICEDPEKCVSTFPLPKVEERQRRRLNCVQILRLNDIIDTKASKSCECNGDNCVCKHIVGWGGEREQCCHTGDSKQLKLDLDIDCNICNNSLYPLPYPQQTVATTFQRKMQRELLREASRAIIESFNKEVATLRRDKEKLQKTWEDLSCRLASL